MRAGTRMAIGRHAGSAGPATSLAFGTQPANVAAGATMTAWTVEARKRSGGVDTDYAASIAATLTGTPSVRNIAQFTSANSEYLSYAAGNTPFGFGGLDLYISMWARMDTAPAGPYAMTRGTTTGNAREFRINFASRLPSISISTDGTAYDVTASWGSALTLGTLYFVEFWLTTGVELVVCVNMGTPVRVATVVPIANRGGPTEFGRNTSNYFNGNLANFGFITSETAAWDSRVAGSSAPPAALRAALYRGGKVPFASELAAVLPYMKRSGGASGDLFFALDEVSGSRASYSGNYTLTDNNTVTSEASGESAPAAEVPSGTLSKAATAGVASYGDIVIARPGTYQFTAASDPLVGATSSSFTVS